MPFLKRRFKHVENIAHWWWAVIYGAWTLLCSVDVLVEHYGSDLTKTSYNNAWIAPKWGWGVWVVGLLVITVFAILEGSYRHTSALEQKHQNTLQDSAVVKADLESRLYEGRPLLVLHVAEIAGSREKPAIVYDKSPIPPARKKKLPKFVIDIKNCGDRTARWITVSDAQSQQCNYRVAFARITSLEPKSSSPLTFEVTRVAGGQAATLDDFLNDTGEDAYVTWYDVTIGFRDTDESMQTEIARISYWPGECVLASSEVPYTRKDIKQPQ